MSIMIHDAIVVTAYGSMARKAAIAQQKAREFGLITTELIEAPINGCISFMIAPDGADENCPESDMADTARAKWIGWALRHSGIEFVHVRYGEFGADDRAEIVDHSYSSPNPSKG